MNFKNKRVIVAILIISSIIYATSLIYLGANSSVEKKKIYITF